MYEYRNIQNIWIVVSNYDENKILRLQTLSRDELSNKKEHLKRVVPIICQGIYTFLIFSIQRVRMK